VHRIEKTGGVVLALKSTENVEAPDYLSNRPIDASIAADAIRRHWHIEIAHTMSVTSRSVKTPPVFEPT